MQQKKPDHPLPPEVRRVLRKHGILLAEVLDWKVYPGAVVLVKKSGHKIRLAVPDDTE